MKPSTEVVALWDIELRVEFYCTPEEPAIFSGPPENCCPGEPAMVDIISVYLNSDSVTDILCLLSEDASNSIEDILLKQSVADSGS